MKDITGQVETTGNVDSTNAVECGISAAGLGHIMSILSNMYSNKSLAVLREYACNARDSHIEAGQTRPIEVTLPSVLQPSLLIRDYGVGLTEKQVIEIFGTYGESTKRDTNDQVGAFGIGSKAAFTMGQQFVVTAAQDGHKVVALFALNERNVGTINIMQRGETDEPNGVLVSLAVDDVEAMRDTAEAFFATWRKGTVLVNGVEPDTIYDRGFAVNDEVHVIPGESGVTAVMGAVGYPVSSAILYKVVRHLSDEMSRVQEAGGDVTGLKAANSVAQSLTGWSGKALFLHVEIGDVDIAPSREALRDTKRTVGTLAGVLERLADDLVTSVETKVAEAPTWLAAKRVLADSEALLKGFPISLSKIQWDGKNLGDVEVALPYLYLYKKGYRSSKMVLGTDYKGTTMTLGRLEDTVVITGVAEDEVGKVSRFARRYLESTEHAHILVSPSRKGTYDWFEFGTKDSEVDTMTLEEFRATLKTLRASVPRSATEPAYSLGTYREQDKDDRVVLSEILEEDQPIALFEDDMRNPFPKALEGYTAVTLLATQSRVAFEKRVGDVEIVDGRSLIKTYAQKIVDGVTDAQREGLAAQQFLARFGYSSWEKAWKTYERHEDDILNEEFFALKDTVEKAREAAKAAKGLDDAQTAAAFLGTNIKASSTTEWPETVEDVDDVFPLLPISFGYWDEKGAKKARKIQHGVAYLNGLALS